MNGQKYNILENNELKMNSKKVKKCMHGADNKSRSETTNPDTLGNLQTEYSCHDFGKNLRKCETRIFARASKYVYEISILSQTY